MAEISVKYSDLQDRTERVKEQEAKKLRMLYDNFDPDWKPGQEPHGTMVFTDEIEIVAKPKPIRDLASELDALKVKVAILQSKIGL